MAIKFHLTLPEAPKSVVLYIGHSLCGVLPAADKVLYIYIYIYGKNH